MKRQIATVLYATILLLAVASHATAQQKTIKACQDQWRANREQNQANGITQKSYVDSCRAGTAAAAPAPTPPQTVPPSASPPAPSPAPARRADPRPPAQASPGAGNQFTTEAQAKARCPADTVVWQTFLRASIISPGRTTTGTPRAAPTCARATRLRPGTALRRMKSILEHECESLRL